MTALCEGYLHIPKTYDTCVPVSLMIMRWGIVKYQISLSVAGFLLL